ncbi:MAG: oxidoreductase [Gracilibacter sp. BRH_c7a]|nr:MAG: oxidoreductase [Gracilibacter sp. BRH_c7a]
MKKWHLIIDVEKCEDCNNCFLACKDEHIGNEWPGYTLPQPRFGQRWMNIMRTERGQYPLIDVAYRPTTCMQCDDALCVQASDGAITKRADGIVLIDSLKAKGKKELVNACPYQMIWWNEEEDVPQKCTLCAHLLDQGWKQPRCVQVCPTGALQAVSAEDADLQYMVREESLEVLHPEFNTRPSVYYKNMHRFEKEFIAGSVAVQKGELIDCAESVAVKLLKGNEIIGETITDNFGDFKIDQLTKNSGEYTVEIYSPGVKIKSLPVDLKNSVNLGVILFED